MAMKKVGMSAGESHELLAGGVPPYPNNISAREMDSLTAICDTLFPSVVLPSGTGQVDPLVQFYRTSASMAGTHERLGGVVSGRLKHRAVGLIRLALWLLSTWWGTFAMCGRRSLAGRFPYFQKFSSVAQKQREEILLSWSLSSFILYKMFFKAMKFIISILFFTRADKKNQNPSWPAIGYCGPDPRFVDPKQRSNEEDSHGPLHDNVVDAAENEEVITEAFRRAGFSTTASTHSSPFIVHCDAVVVGSGCGGSVVAGELAKAGHKVIVVEKGRYFSRRDLSLLEGPSMDQMYEGGGLVATDDLSVVVLAGSTVGGGSAINWSASIPTPGHVLNEWCDKHELKLFGSKVFQNALDVVCDRMGVQNGVSEEGFNNAVLRKGCLELGYPVTTVPRNSPPDHYCGWCHLGCRDGRKRSVHETWLCDLVNSGNGIILQGCNVSKILHKPANDKSRNVATGIVADKLTILSSVTIVAGGALNTPALLKRSGLKNPNIGRHLHLHPVVMVWGHFPEDDDEEDIFNKKKSYEGGIITTMSTIVANFDTTGYGAVIQTPALHPGMFSALMPWISSRDFRDRMCKFSRTAHLFALARDLGSGYSSEYPESLVYTLDPKDEAHLKLAVEKMLRILAAAGAAEIGTQQSEGKIFDVKNGTKDEFEEFVKMASGKGMRDLSTPMCSAHQMGSCRMGVEPKVSVVSPRCETWEVERLFVADTSVFPTAIGVNPMVTVQAVAYCTAQNVLEVLGRRKKKNN